MKRATKPPSRVFLGDRNTGSAVIASTTAKRAPEAAQGGLELAALRARRCPRSTPREYPTGQTGRGVTGKLGD